MNFLERGGASSYPPFSVCQSEILFIPVSVKVGHGVMELGAATD